MGVGGQVVLTSRRVIFLDIDPETPATVDTNTLQTEVDWILAHT